MQQAHGNRSDFAGEAVDGMTTFVLRPDNGRDRMAAAWRFACQFLELGRSVKVTVEEAEPLRTLDQNDKLNAMCGDVAAQVEWHGQWLGRDDWRHMFVASYRKGQRVVPGIDGGFVVLGASSRKLTKRECADVIEIIYAFGAERGVQWGDDRREAA